MGSSVKKVVETGVRVGAAMVSGGASEKLWKKKKKVGGVSNAAEKTLAQEQEESRKKRARLYATAGNANGEEVATVGLSGDVRGNIFGNK